MDWVFIALLVGIFLGFAAQRLFKRLLDRVAAARTPAPEPDPPSTRAAQVDLYTLADRLNDYFQQSAHPRDLLEHDDFQRGVACLGGPRYGIDAVLVYATGEHVLIACMALEALHHRDDVGGDLIARLVDHVPRSYVWPLFFLLRVLRAHSPEPVVSAVLLSAQEWWPQNGSLLQILRAFIEQRVGDGEEPALGDALEALPGERVAAVEALLEALGTAPAAALLDELWQWQHRRVDTDYLQSVGRIWRDDGESEIIEHPALREYLAVMETALLKQPARSVLLTGPEGVGKTALIHVLAQRIRQQGWTVFEAGGVEILAGRVYIGELEERVQALIKALGGGRKVLWVVPGFHDLAYAGRHRYSPSSVLDMVLPFIENGSLLVVGEIRPASYDRLLQSHPRLRALFDVLRIQPLDDQDTLALAEAWIARQPGPAVLLDDQTLKEAFHLAQQYLGDKAAPGHLLHFLQRARRHLDAAGRADGALSMDDLLVTLSGLTGLPTSILDDRQSLDLGTLEALFKRRVLGQPEAAEALVERVAMIKAGLTDPTRPLGVFLFVGPTGTGKTEIAKTLATFLFGSPERMIRLDMSEFQIPESLDRLIGESDEPSGQEALVNQIRKQPFAVILLDEFEKAHPRVWDLFLQVFDDGRLTGRRGNTADFRHSIIILTSNLGAVAARGTSIGFGAPGAAFSSGSVQRAVKETFRPEFINRIDSVVVFRPLSRGVMRDILHKELTDVLQRRGLRTRGWAVEWEDSALEFLLEKGFTADLGARPLKRSIERHLLAPLARTIVSHQFPEGDQFLFIRSDGSRLQVEFIDPEAPADEPVVPVNGALETSEGLLVLETLMLDPQGQRPEVNFLKGVYDRLTATIGTEAWAAQKQDALGQMGREDFWESQDRFRVLGDVEYMDRIEAGLQTAGSLLQRLGGTSSTQRTSFSRDLVGRLAQQLYLLDAAYTGLEEQLPRDAFLMVEARPDAQRPTDTTEHFARQISRMYQRWAEKRRMRYAVLREAHRDGRYYCQLAVSGFGAFRLLMPEAGFHVFEAPRGEGDRAFLRSKVWVRVAPQPLVPPMEAETLLEQATAAFAGEGDAATTIVRRYREEPSPLVRDSARQWRTGRLDRVLEGDFDLIR